MPDPTPPLADAPSDAASDAAIANLSFEDALRQLQQVVQRLESGDAPLDESIRLYAQGANLRSHCEARLKAAQAQIEAIVLDRDGAPSGTRPFGED